ncbi:hypothetical protein SDC9_183640 [bioreactor metagenome]|uniref:Uncharacterized protein n=1 Tax=bioreactor metagenome TaxID=1076179 RepID=A0A645HJ34_9ZZZZ
MKASLARHTHQHQHLRGRQALGACRVQGIHQIARSSVDRLVGEHLRPHLFRPTRMAHRLPRCVQFVFVIQADFHRLALL